MMVIFPDMALGLIRVLGRSSEFAPLVIDGFVESVLIFASLGGVYDLSSTDAANKCTLWGLASLLFRQLYYYENFDKSGLVGSVLLLIKFSNF